MRERGERRKKKEAEENGGKRRNQKEKKRKKRGGGQKNVRGKGGKKKLSDSVTMAEKHRAVRILLMFYLEFLFGTGELQKKKS